MIRYLAKRALWSVVILFGVCAATFAMNNLVPGDPVLMMAGRNATKEIREQIRRDYALYRPVYVQFGLYVARLAEGDLGRSYRR